MRNTLLIRLCIVILRLVHLNTPQEVWKEVFGLLPSALNTAIVFYSMQKSTYLPDGLCIIFSIFTSPSKEGSKQVVENHIMCHAREESL